MTHVDAPIGYKQMPYWQLTLLGRAYALPYNARTHTTTKLEFVAFLLLRKRKLMGKAKPRVLRGLERKNPVVRGTARGGVGKLMILSAWCRASMHLLLEP